MIDARKIYECIRSYASLTDTVFCDLHKCDNPKICQSTPQHFMLNFDEVKNTYCSSKRIGACKSADGLSYNNNGILFIIEIKGWESYRKFSNPKNEQEIENKVANYKLSRKLSDSLMICKNVLTDNESITLPITLPIVYLVVSDIKDEGIERIESNLSLLAETSSNFSDIYGNAIKSQLSNIFHIDVGFVENCQQIDTELDSWTKARDVEL